MLLMDGTFVIHPHETAEDFYMAISIAIKELDPSALLGAGMYRVRVERILDYDKVRKGERA